VTLGCWQVKFKSALADGTSFGNSLGALTFATGRLRRQKQSYNLAMRRLLATAAFVLLTLPVQAQMRSAGRGMGAPRGFAGRSVVVNRGPGVTTAWRSGMPFHRFGGSFFPGPFFPGRFFPGRFHHRGSFFFSGSFGFPWFGSSAWYGYSGFYPAYNYPLMSYSYPATSYSYPPLDSSYPLNSSYFANADDQRIENRLDRLEERMNRFLDEQYEKSASAQAARTESKSEPSPATILIFRDKHSEEVNNYAVVGETLWVLDEQKARKIPLADLDVAATTRRNEERGVVFQTAK
jgi:hypothetical protein